MKNLLLGNIITYKLYLYYDIYLRNFYKKKTGFYSQWGEDKYIDEFFKYKSGGFYFDIGAFHPIKYSNTCLLHKKGWKGVNIDANKTSIDLFNIARPKDLNICAAVSDNNSNIDFFIDHKLAPINTLDKSMQKKMSSVFFKNMKIQKVKTQTLKDLDKSLSLLNKTDFLNIDVEGFDYKVLKQINLKESKIKLASIETHYPDGAKNNDSEAIFNYLDDNKYEIYKRIGPTTLFKKK
tara:strand:- start:97 stop:804 length:708 start_codon:yes stop_codon:yes gene_type:complete